MGFLRQLSGIRTLLKVWDCIFSWEVEDSTNKEIADTEVVIGLSFGQRKDTPGPINEKLADEIFLLPVNLPLILQQEIASALLPNEKLANLPQATESSKTAFPPELFVISEHSRKPGKYLDTREVLTQAAAICKERGWKKIILVAHPDHMWRVKESAKKLGFALVRTWSTQVFYDPESAQFWTRNRAFFVIREIPARIIYLLKGWI